MLRIQKLETIYKEQLINHNVNNVSNFIQSILNADITKGKYARFLIEAFLNDKFLEEDLIGGLNSTVGQAIFLFHKHKSKLSENMRSVYALDKETGEALYQSPGDLWNSVKQFQGELSGKELKKEEQEQIYRETEFIYKDEETGFQIVSPLTEESAQWWGKGTRWCTSAEKNNQFERYNKKAPLFILLMSTSAGNSGNRNKLQLWKNDNNIQFMDELDNTVSLQYIEQNWSVLEPICRWLNDLKFIPSEYITKELCELAVQKNGHSLNYVPEHLKTPEFCEVAVKNHGYALQYVPDELITKELFKLAVQSNECALKWIPKELRTKELCELAIEQDGNNLAYVPDEYKTQELCELAVQKDGIALEYVPENIITKELCELAVQNNDNSFILYSISEEYKTPELCEMAIKKNGLALHFVPKELKTIEMCKLAVKQNEFSLQYVPEDIINKELCELAVQKDGWYLSYVPVYLRTKELCELAVKQNGWALKWVPDEYKTKEICKMAVKSNGMTLDYVPEHLRTKEMCELECQQKKKEEVFINTKDKHQIIYQKLKEYFPEKHISLSYHS